MKTTKDTMTAIELGAGEGGNRYYIGTRLITREEIRREDGESVTVTLPYAASPIYDLEGPYSFPVAQKIFAAV